MIIIENGQWNSMDDIKNAIVNLCSKTVEDMLREGICPRVIRGIFEEEVNHLIKKIKLDKHSMDGKMTVEIDGQITTRKIDHYETFETDISPKAVPVLFSNEELVIEFGKDYPIIVKI